MKKFISFLLIGFFIVFSAPSVFAVNTDGVMFKTEDAQCSLNRIIAVEVRAKSNQKLSAVLFKFSYDRNILEYRSISTPSDSIAYAYDNGQALNVSYLCKNGKNVSNESTVFTLKFKAIALGKSDLKYTAYDCVNSLPESAEISKCESGTVYVQNENSNLGEEDTEEQENLRKSSDDEKYEGKDIMGSLNSEFADNNTFMLVVGLLSGIAVCVLCFILYLFVKKRKNKAKDEKQSH